MKAHKLPSGSWRVQVQVNGKRMSITARTKKEAERKASESILSRLEAPEKPLKVAVEDFIADRSKVLSPSTIERYERCKQKYFSELMDVKLKYLTEERIQRAVNRMSEKYAPKTVRNAWGLISSALKAQGIEMKVKLPQKIRPEYHLPTEAEVFELINHSSRNLRTAVILAAFCGLRRGEIVALESSDIVDGVIHVHRCAVYDATGAVVTKQPKTYTGDRYIKAPDYVLDALKGIEGRVCPVKPSGITAGFIKLRNRLGLKCRFHDLRHFYASWLHAMGVRDQYILERGGWHSDAVLKEVYRGTLSDESEQVDKMINERITSHAVHADA